MSTDPDHLRQRRIQLLTAAYAFAEGVNSDGGSVIDMLLDLADQLVDRVIALEDHVTKLERKQ